MKKIFILFFIMLSHPLVKAQLNLEVKSQIESALLSYYNTIGSESYFLPNFKQRAFVFGFIISVNKTGKVDTVIFSNKTKKLDSLVSFTSIEKRIKKISGFDKFRNTNMIGFALIRRQQDNAITNFYDTYMRRQYKEKQDFDEYFIDMIPTIPIKLNSRKTLLLPAFGLIQMPSIR